MAKAATWTGIDAEVRKRGEQTGLDTLVVDVYKRQVFGSALLKHLDAGKPAAEFIARWK